MSADSLRFTSLCFGARSTRAALCLPLLLALSTACGDCGEPDDPTPDQSVTPPPAEMGGEDADMDPLPEDMPPDLEQQPDMRPDMRPDAAPDMPVDLSIPEGPAVRPIDLFLFPPTPVDCDNPGAEGRYRIPTAVIVSEVESNLRRVLRPYDRIAGRPLIPNQTVNVGSLTSERTRIGTSIGDGCVADTECQDGFVCARGGNRAAERVCVRQTNVALVTDSVQVDYDPGGQSKQQLVSVLYENSGGLVGFTPIDVGALFDDAGMTDPLKLDARASDAATLSRPALEQLFTFIASYADVSNTRLSAWWFAGDTRARVRPITNVTSNEDHFTSNLEEPIPLIDGLPLANPQLGTGNVYQAIMRVVEKDFSPSKFDDHEKFMFLIVDGPNEVWDAEATRETVTAALLEHDIHLFVIHFDSALDASLLRDPLAYWAGNRMCRDSDSCATALPCATNNDCQNFETCRTVTLYSEAAGTPTQQTPLSYCVPSYREDGRLGPINAYADMACRTGGNYIYLTNTKALDPTLKQLPAVIDGQWSYEAQINALDPERLAAGFYRLSGVFLGLFGNSSIAATIGSSILGPCVTDPAQDCVKVSDNRPVLRLGNVE